MTFAHRRPQVRLGMSRLLLLSLVGIEQIFVHVRARECFLVMGVIAFGTILPAITRRASLLHSQSPLPFVVDQCIALQLPALLNRIRFPAAACVVKHDV